jgi:oligopeptide transport system substrate-binding protein
MCLCNVLATTTARDSLPGEETQPDLNCEDYERTMISKTRLTVGIFLVATLNSCGHQEPGSDRAEVLRRGLSGEPSTLDPAGAADNFSAEVLRDLYEGLTTESPTGEVVPGVAASWTVDPGGRRYTFKLRFDARWSNGSPVRARDFVAAWRRVVDPKQGSPLADDFRFLTGAQSIIEGKAPVTDLGVSAPSDDILVVNLEQPVPYFPQLLTHSAAYPVFSEASTRSHDPKTSITNGPYSLASWSPSTALVLTRNERYWNRANVHIRRVEYQFITDENAQYARFRAGQLDMTDTVPPNAVPALRSQNSPELFIAPFLATAYYGLNLAKPPLAGNLKLRQALAMAIDRKKVVSALGAGQAEAFGYVPGETSNYSPQTWSWKNLSDDTRLAEAKRLYTEAGYSWKNPLHLRLLFNSNAGIKNTAIIVAAMWKEVLNIDTELTEEEYRVFLQSRHDKSRWDVVRLGWTADYNDASNFLDAFRQHSENNDEAYANAAFDTLVGDASQTPDTQLRRTKLEMSEATMLADYPVIPLYFFVSKRLVKIYVKGFQPNAMNHIYSRSLTVGSQKP